MALRDLLILVLSVGMMRGEDDGGTAPGPIEWDVVAMGGVALAAIALAIVAVARTEPWRPAPALSALAGALLLNAPALWW